MSHKRAVKTDVRAHERRTRIAALYLKGIRSYRDIAKEMGVVISTVCKDLKAIKEDWKQLYAKDFSEAVAEVLAEIEVVKQTAWLEWEKSRGTHRKIRREKKPGQKGITESIETEELCGDPRYLDKVEWCINKKIEILGLEAPKKINMDVGASGDGKLTIAVAIQQILADPQKVQQEIELDRQYLGDDGTAIDAAASPCDSNAGAVGEADGARVSVSPACPDV